MTPKFDNLVSLLMEGESPEERADRIKDMESRGYGKSKRILPKGPAPVKDFIATNQPIIQVDQTPGYTKDELRKYFHAIDISTKKPADPQARKKAKREYNITYRARKKKEREEEAALDALARRRRDQEWRKRWNIEFDKELQRLDSDKD